ncbi:MAG: molybdopterin cofactor-binding domain-containing protein, partial [Anaerolineae bacterium]
RGRHPVPMRLRTGVAADGTLTAMHVQTVLDGGAYGSYGVATTYYTGALQTVTYRLGAYRFEAARVYTNKPPCGPKRGHGTPQGRFALEVQLDKIAHAMGLGPAEVRLRNLVAANTPTVNHMRVTSCGLRECIEAVVAASEFRQRHGRLPRGRGLGLACGAYLSGAGLPVYWNDLPHSTVVVQVDRSGRVTAQSGATDIGQGSDTILATIVADVLGLAPADIRLVTADTGVTPVDLGSYSSRVTFMMGNAALDASRSLRGRILAAVARDRGTDEAALTMAGGKVCLPEGAGEDLTLAEAVRIAEAAGAALSAEGSYRPPDLAGPYRGSGVGPSPAYSYSACVVEAKVDEGTGAVEPAEVWLAHDVGRALNPQLVEGQIEGGVYMGLSEALLEEQAFRGPLHAGPSLLEVKTPTALDVPPIHAIIVETVDAEGPYGAKEVGQGPLLPVPPAVANAVFDAVGVRVDEVPITPDKVHRAMELARRGKGNRVGPKRFPAVTFPEVTVVPPPAGAPVPVTAGHGDAA